jgi:hypothetical protein
VTPVPTAGDDDTLIDFSLQGEEKYGCPLALQLQLQLQLQDAERHSNSNQP